MCNAIAFLHTSEAHVETFDELMLNTAPELQVIHLVDEKLLQDARHEGITQEIKTRIHSAMSKAASSDAAVVVCTCSTIGSVAEQFEQSDEFVSMRIDRAMADQSVKTGNRILVVAALESTLGPTRHLIESSAEKFGKRPAIELLCVRDAWSYFESGENEKYFRVIADVLNTKWKDYDVIVLAQASMAGATPYANNVEIPVLSSPALGVEAAVQAYAKPTGTP